MSRTLWVVWVCIGALIACKGDDPNLPTGSDAGTSGSSGTSGTSGNAGEKLAFVTDVEIDGDFGTGASGGLGAGDKICTDEARAAGRTSGTFKALLCVGAIGTSGLERMGAGPWKLHDGSEVPAKAVWGSQPVLVNRTAAGLARSGRVWTGCDDTGKTQENCQNWTDAFVGPGRAGEIGAVNTEWLSNSVIPCSDSRRLYCFED